eukprot:TRINITY_DN10867_c0_g1_i1.p1 TRINITY_DN10867_c0_g1~~TRINITY_DN10867_c0_g1_i1.p1  ORF type:complete len:344 (+),score=14.90 TRINITY_DN10867_c0_g1_i1:69-1100(+)
MATLTIEALGKDILQYFLKLLDPPRLLAIRRTSSWFRTNISLEALFQSRLEEIRNSTLVRGDKIGSRRSRAGKIRRVYRQSDNKVFALQTSMAPAADGFLMMLVRMRHPFIVNHHWFYRSKDEIFVVMDFVSEKTALDLVTFPDKSRPLSPEQARFLAAEIVLALEHLHKLGIIFHEREFFTPSNILIAPDGHVRLVDFQYYTREKQGRFCGTPEYIAPEVITAVQVLPASDYWALGNILYELMSPHCLPPFYHENIQKMYMQVLSKEVEFPGNWTEESKSLILAVRFCVGAFDVIKLLDRDPLKRLSDPDALKAHPFFAGVDWKKLYWREVESPFKAHAGVS